MDQQSEAATMSGRLATGPIATEQALDYGLSLAKELKRRQQPGSATGPLHPDRIALNGSSASIVGDSGEKATPYSAPEQWAGNAGDIRSDIFSFGAVFYELLTGHRAVEGKTAKEWSASLLRRENAPPNGIQPAVAQVIDRCLKRRPEERWQTFSAVIVELKLAAAAQRHAKAAVDWKRWLSTLQADLGEVGGRLAAHQSAHEAALSEVHRAIGEVAAKTDEHAASAAQSLQTLGASVSATAEKLGSLHESVGAASDKLGTLGDSVASAHRRLETLGDTVSEANGKLGSLGDSVDSLSGKADTQARAIESLQSAVHQTDEVIDHVVDAFDSMHRMVVERAEAGIAVASPRPN